MTGIDPSSHLYLHPSDATAFANIEKLQGSTNFRSWKRSMEISLASKRKLGFVTGAYKKDTDPVKAEHWETCNNTVISWIIGTVSDNIKKSIMFMTNSSLMWKQLDQRFSLTNGSRKYKLNRDLYETKQMSKSISDYYTVMRGLWEELESLNDFPPITTMTTEINAFVQALNQQQEEQKLFQFLNGVDDHYSPQRSQLLMMSPLPSLETACSYLQQEESQRDILSHIKEEGETLAMYSKGNDSTCTACGKPGHTGDKCWSVVGYPSWHARSKQNTTGKGAYKGKGKSQYSAQQKWNKGKQGSVKIAANAQGGESCEAPVISHQQIEHLLRMLPMSSKSSKTAGS
ncbi:uncharacterized protein [Spinacia oleracea]|uniref:CCHC-type domain-containing protein n=1 Tax=Spinacia oleracea TaxID=3562 RepID=A0A9R0IIC9_SPIOL|nr:uncharacterized protein LOC110788857 [Spinacia oleracea]